MVQTTLVLLSTVPKKPRLLKNFFTFRGFIFLSLLFETNKDFCHECLLTSISLNPQRATVTKLVDIAKERGLVEASFTIDAPVVKKVSLAVDFSKSFASCRLNRFLLNFILVQRDNEFRHERF